MAWWRSYAATIATIGIWTAANYLANIACVRADASANTHIIGTGISARRWRRCHTTTIGPIGIRAAADSLANIAYGRANTSANTVVIRSYVAAGWRLRYATAGGAIGTGFTGITGIGASAPAHAAVIGRRIFAGRWGRCYAPAALAIFTRLADIARVFANTAAYAIVIRRAIAQTSGVIVKVDGRQISESRLTRAF